VISAVADTTGMHIFKGFCWGLHSFPIRADLAASTMNIRVFCGSHRGFLQPLLFQLLLLLLFLLLLLGMELTMLQGVRLCPAACSAVAPPLHMMLAESARQDLEGTLLGGEC